MNTKAKYASAFILVALLLLGVNQVMADDASGTLEILREGPYVRDVVMPSPVDPDVLTPVEFRIECIGGYKMDNIEYILVVWHLSTVSKTGADDIRTRYSFRADLDFNAIWTFTYDENYFTNLVLPPNNYGEADWTFTMDLTFSPIASAGSWLMDAYVVGLPAGSEDNVVTPFEVNDFLQFTLQETSFEFEDAFQGDIDLVISNPTSGHLTFNVIANFDWTVEVMGTNLAGPAGAIPVTRVSHNSVGVVSEESLLLTWAPLFGLGVRPACAIEAGEDVSIFLFLDVPSGQAHGVYTMTFSVQALAAV